MEIQKYTDRQARERNPERLDHSKRLPQLAIVLPCFNEVESIDYAVAKLSGLLKQMVDEGSVSENSYLFFVDDGSSDNSWQKIEDLNQQHPHVKGLKLSRNFGHQSALLAGLAAVANTCDAAISIDTDLQQDPLAIKQFVDEYSNGADIVLGIRRDRDTDGSFKKQTALGFYKLMKIMGVNIVPNHADYRLLSRKALEALMLYPEPNIFLRAICLQLGFRVSSVYFDVEERKYGQTKYSLKKMLRLAVNGITSFSIVPLRMVAMVGFMLFVFSLGMAIYVAWRALVVGDTVSGWASTTLPIYFIGGVQLLCLGVVGEYVGQIYATVKDRPRWICERRLD
jgi:glycosyltransferase involved in cell wall biosynthesis